MINVGIENIRKVDVHYCDLCRMYLPRAEEGDIDKILSKHCKQRTHLQKYIRYKEDKELTKRAERLQRKETAEKEREKDKVRNNLNYHANCLCVACYQNRIDMWVSNETKIKFCICFYFLIMANSNLFN